MATDSCPAGDPPRSPRRTPRHTHGATNYQVALPITGVGVKVTKVREQNVLQCVVADILLLMRIDNSEEGYGQG